MMFESCIFWMWRCSRFGIGIQNAQVFFCYLLRGCPQPVGMTIVEPQSLAHSTRCPGVNRVQVCEYNTLYRRMQQTNCGIWSVELICLQSLESAELPAWCSWSKIHTGVKCSSVPSIGASYSVTRARNTIQCCTWCDLPRPGIHEISELFDAPLTEFGALAI